MGSLNASLLKVLGWVGLSASTSLTAQSVWIPVGGSTTWGSANNWSTGVVPVTGTNVVINSSTARTSGGQNTVQILDDAIIRSLKFEYISTVTATHFHQVHIAQGKTLTISNTDTAAGNAFWVDMSNPNYTTTTQFTGGGSLVIQSVNQNFVVANTMTAGTPIPVTLDLSGLNTFSATVKEFNVASAGNISRANVKFANENQITADIVRLGAANGNTGGANDFYFGQTNVFHANDVIFGTGRNSATLHFNTGVNTADATVTIRGRTGGDSRANLVVGGNTSSFRSWTGGSSLPTGIMDFQNAELDFMLDRLVLGIAGSVGSERAGHAIGKLTMGAGIIDANHISVGHSVPVNSIATSDDASVSTEHGVLHIKGGTVRTSTLTIAENLDTSTGVNFALNGRVTIDDGELNVAEDVILGLRPSASPTTGLVRANFYINGGVVTIGGDLKEGNGGTSTLTTSNVIVNGGVLDMQGGSIQVDNFSAVLGTLKNVGSFLPSSQIYDGDYVVAFDKAGAFDFILDGQNDFHGMVRLSWGTLQIGSGGAEGTLGRDGVLLQGSGIVDFNRSDSFLVNQRIVGVSTTKWTHSGSGQMIYTGDASEFTGALEIGSGQFILSDNAKVQSLKSVLVKSGATLGFNGELEQVMQLGSTSSVTTFEAGSKIQTNLGSNLNIRGTVTSTGGGSVYLFMDAKNLGSSTPGQHVVIQAAGGLSGLNYEALLLNATNYTLGSLDVQSTQILANLVASAELDNAYWVGGRVAGFEDSWAVSGATSSNWASDSSGTVTSLVPGANTTVYLSQAASTVSTARMQADMSIGELHVTQTGAFTLNDHNHTLTLTRASALQVGAGTGPVVFNAALEFAHETPSISIAANRTVEFNRALLGNLFTKTGAGTLVLGGAENNMATGQLHWSEGLLVLAKTGGAQAIGGNIRIDSSTLTSATLKLEGSEQIIDSSDVYLSSTATLDLNGHVETIDALNSEAGAKVTSSAIGTATLKIGGGNEGSAEFRGVIQNGAADKRVALEKIGTGTQVLLGINTFTGGTVVSDGTLRMGHASALSTAGKVTVRGENAVLATTNGMVHKLGAFSLIQGTVSGPGVVELTTGAELHQGSLLSVVRGAGNLIKTSTGTVALGAANTFTGEIHVLEGTLVAGVNNALGTGRVLRFGAGEGAGANSTAGSLDIGTTKQSVGNVLVNSTGAASLNEIIIGSGGELAMTGQNFHIGPVGSTTLNNVSSKLKISGEGTFKMTNSNGRLYIGQTTGTNVSYDATLDMSELANFQASLGASGIFRLGAGDNTVARRSYLYLAKNSTITTGNLQLGTSAQGAIQTVYLGSGVNTINATTILLGTGSRDQVQFGFLESDTTGSLKLEGFTAGSRANLSMATGTSATAGTGTAGTALGTGFLVDLRGHHSELLLNEVIIANQPRGANVRAEFFFDKGVLDMNTLKLGSRGVNSAASASNTRETYATLHLGGGVTHINQGILELGYVTGDTVGDGDRNRIRKAQGTLLVYGDATVNIGNTDGVAIRMAKAEQATVGTTGSTGVGEFVISDQANVTIDGHIYEQGGLGTTLSSLKLTGAATLDMTGHTVVVDDFILESGTLKNLGEYATGNEQNHTVSAITKSGTGTLVLEGENTFTGELKITNGTVQVGSGGTTGTLGQGAVQLQNANSVLSLNRSNELFVSQAITGAGSVHQVGAGTLLLTHTANSYSGGTVVEQGTLQIANFAALGTGTVQVNSQGALKVFPNAESEVTGHMLLNASQSLVIQDGGSLTLGIGVGVQFAKPVNFSGLVNLGFDFGNGVSDSLFASGDWVYDALLATSGLDQANYQLLTFNVTDYITSIDQVSAGQVRVRVEKASASNLSNLTYWKGGTIQGYETNWSVASSGATNWVNDDGLVRRATLHSVTDAAIGDRFSNSNLSDMKLGAHMKAKSLTFESPNGYMGTISVSDQEFGITLHGDPSLSAGTDTILRSTHLGRAELDTSYVEIGSDLAKIDLAPDTILELNTELRGNGFQIGGGGTLELSGNTSNTYVGNVTVAEGILILNKATGVKAITGDISVNDYSLLRVQNDGAFDMGSNLYLGTGAAMILEGTTTHIQKLEGYGDVANDHAQQSAHLVVGSQGDSFDFHGGFQFSGKELILEKAGAGTLTLHQTMAKDTQTRVTGGTLAIGKHDVIRGSLSVDGGTLDLGNYVETVNRLELKNGGELKGNLYLISTVNYDLQDGTVNLTLNGSAASTGLAKNGSGTVIINSNNQYQGTTTINLGVIRATTNQSLGSNGSALIVNGGSTTDVTAGTLELTGDITLQKNTTIGGRGTANLNLAALRNVSGNNTLQGNVTYNSGGSHYNIESASGKLTLLGNMAGNGNTTGATRMIVLSGAGDGEIQGNISDGPAANASFGIEKRGNGTWTVAGTQTYTNTTKVTAGRFQFRGTHTNAGAYEIQTGSTFAGTGSILLQGGLSFGVDTNASLYVGDTASSVGLLSLTTSGAGAVSFGVDSKIHLDLFGAGGHGTQFTTESSDRLVITGSLTTGTGVQVVLSANNTSQWTVGDTYRLFDWTQVTGGTSQVQFQVVNDSYLQTLGAVWDVTELYSMGTVRLAMIPEPTKAMLLLMGITWSFLRRRREIR